MRKIYIATPVNFGNYGNRLQNFAVHRICEKINLDPVTLAAEYSYKGKIIGDDTNAKYFDSQSDTYVESRRYCNREKYGEMGQRKRMESYYLTILG